MAPQTKLLLLVSFLGCCIASVFFVGTTITTEQARNATLQAQKTSSPDEVIVVARPAPAVYFTGDVMLARHVEVLLRDQLVHPYDFINLFASSSAVVINFESAMSDPHIPTESGVMRFSTAVASLPILRDLSVTHASLANNHSRDYGREGNIHAREELAAYDIATFGDAVTVSSSSLTYTNHGSTTLAIIGIHTLFVSPDRDVLRTLLHEAKAKSDIQLVYIHWGDEYMTTHNANQQELATWLIKEGIDAIVGHHPHVVQDIDVIAGVPVFYSLGNFIFDQYFSEDVKTGLVLGLTVTEHALIWQLYPQKQCAKATPCLMDKKSEEAFLLALADRSNKTFFDQIMAKNIVIPR